MPNLNDNEYSLELLTDQDYLKRSGGIVSNPLFLETRMKTQMKEHEQRDGYMPADHGLFDRKIFGRVGTCWCKSTRVNPGEPRKVCPQCKDIVWGTEKELREAIGVIVLAIPVVLPPKIKVLYKYLHDHIFPKTIKFNTIINDSEIINRLWNHEYKIFKDSSGEFKYQGQRFRLDIRPCTEVSDPQYIGLNGLTKLNGFEREGHIIDFSKLINNFLPVMSYALRDISRMIMNRKRVNNMPEINNRYSSIIKISELINKDITRMNPDGLEWSAIYTNYNILVAKYILELQILGGKTSSSKYQLLRDLTRKRSEKGLRATIIGDPTLDTNHIAVPEMMAYNCLGKDIVTQLVAQGKTMSEATKLYQRKFKEADVVFNNIIDNCICLIWRAPILHKPSVHAMKPIITKEPVIKLPYMVLDGMGADFRSNQSQL